MKTNGVNAQAKECQVFFSRALSATVDDNHLTITIPQDIELVDSVYADETNDLPTEIRCESPGDREVLAFHLTFRPNNASLEHLKDDRFKLLHTQEKLAEPLAVCVVQRSPRANGKNKASVYSISSASIVRK